MSNEQDEIKNIVAQLKRLQTQESELLQRLERLSEAERQPAASPTPTRDFEIGDLVKTKNPNRFQIREGIVMRTGAGADRVTVQSRNGSSKVVRASFNLTHVD
jgi:dsDNA-specific endonuclease/ATPase MutS2